MLLLLIYQKITMCEQRTIVSTGIDQENQSKNRPKNPMRRRDLLIFYSLGKESDKWQKVQLELQGNKTSGRFERRFFFLTKSLGIALNHSTDVIGLHLQRANCRIRGSLIKNANEQLVNRIIARDSFAAVAL